MSAPQVILVVYATVAILCGVYGYQRHEYVTKLARAEHPDVVLSPTVTSVVVGVAWPFWLLVMPAFEAVAWLYKRLMSS